MAFYGFLAIFPAAAAVIAIWGFVSDPDVIRQEMNLLRPVLPPDVFTLISDQVEGLMSVNSSNLGVTTVLSTVFALWSARAGMAALIRGLNAIHQRPNRSGHWHQLRAVSLTFVLVGLVLAARADHPLAHLPLAEVLASVPLILPPATALIRPAVDAYLASLGLNGVKPAVETVSLALGRGICLQSDAMWFISRGVVIEDLSSGVMAERPTGARFLSGAVGITRRQGDPPGGLALLAGIAHALARPED